MLKDKSKNSASISSHTSNRKARLYKKYQAYDLASALEKCAGLDFTQKREAGKIKKSLYHQIKGLEKLER